MRASARRAIAAQILYYLEFLQRRHVALLRECSCNPPELEPILMPAQPPAGLAVTQIRIVTLHAVDEVSNRQRTHRASEIDEPLNIGVTTGAVAATSGITRVIFAKQSESADGEVS